MARALYLTMLIGICACAADNSSGFSATGSYNVDDELGEDLTGEVSDDTEDTEDTSDTEVSEDAPTIEEASAEIETTGTAAVLLSLGYTDPQEDVEDGVIVCKLSIDGASLTNCLGSDGNQIPIDGTYARIDDGTVESRLALTLDGDEFYFELALVDSAGNQSETIGIYAE